MSGLREDGDRTQFILNMVGAGNQTCGVDEISAWGGMLRYRCVWSRAILATEGPWGCFWALEYPGTTEWAMRFRGVDRPWHGYYESTLIPPGAAVLRKDDIDRFNRQVAFRKKYLT